MVYIKIDNPIYIGRFNHDYFREFQVSAIDFEQRSLKILTLTFVWFGRESRDFGVSLTDSWCKKYRCCLFVLQVKYYFPFMTMLNGFIYLFIVKVKSKILDIYKKSFSNIVNYYTINVALLILN